MKGFTDEKGKFRPFTQYQKKGSRKKREPFEVKKTEGIPLAKLIQMQRADVGRRKHDDESMDLKLIQEQIQKHERELHGMSKSKVEEWESVVGSEIVKVKHEMMDGRPVTTVRFANGEEWFEFDSFDHQEEFMKENNLHKIKHEEGEFIEVDHPMIAGFITMPSGKVLFGEKEDSRMKRDVTSKLVYYNDPSHGYFKVPRKLLIELGIADDITKYSKFQGDDVFLEEDKDATTFFKALEKKGIDFDVNKIKDKYFDTPNENPASRDFGLCEICGGEFTSVKARAEHMKKHKK